jgi:hypothetical protein
MLKYNCMGGGNNKNPKSDKTLDGCAKSQSFYSGMNHVAANNSALSTTTTTTTTAAATASPADSSRVRTNYYNCCDSCYQQQQLQHFSCSTSPSASLASTISLCPSHLLPLDCPSRYPHHQLVQLHVARLPHLHWLPPPSNINLNLPSPYIYSSAYEVESPPGVSPTLSSNVSVEHIYSQIPSPQPTPKFLKQSPQQGK